MHPISARRSGWDGSSESNSFPAPVSRILLGGTVHIDSATVRRQVYQVEYFEQLGTTFVRWPVAATAAGASARATIPAGQLPAAPQLSASTRPPSPPPGPPVVVAHSTFLSALIASPSGAHLGNRISRPASPMAAAQDGAEVGHMLAQVWGTDKGPVRPNARERPLCQFLPRSQPSWGPMAKPLGLAGDRR